ncbi:DNA damage-binding protein 1a [Spatholobus suberectus]|nr:DNA damage-binding protein 1a [Spatholobus suberectus]
MNLEDELEETEIEGFCSQVQTLFCHDAVHNQLVQVTWSSVRLVSSTTRELRNEWHAPSGYAVNVATANATQISYLLCALGDGHLLNFMFNTSTRELTIGKSQESGCENCNSLDHPFHQQLYNYIKQQAILCEAIEPIKQGSFHVKLLNPSIPGLFDTLKLLFLGSSLYKVDFVCGNTMWSAIGVRLESGASESRNDPIKLLKLLDIFRVLDGLRLKFNLLLNEKACKEIRTVTKDLVNGVVSGAGEIFWQLPAHVKLLRPSSPPTDGSVPRVVPMRISIWLRAHEHYKNYYAALYLRNSWEMILPILIVRKALLSSSMTGQDLAAGCDKQRGECKEGSGGSEERVFENEDYVYTNSLP